MYKGRKIVKYLLAIAVTVLLSTALLHAATFTVTKVADTNDDLCDADCSLREAVQAVNVLPPSSGLHQIVFSTLFDTPQSIVLSSVIVVNYSRRIEFTGRGNHNVTITADVGNTGGLLVINADLGKVSNIRFEGGMSDRNCGQIGGGAIHACDGGDLFIDNCIFENNSGENGGAVLVQYASSLTISNSTFRNNSALGNPSANNLGQGGAIYFDDYTVTIKNSTFTGNSGVEGSVFYMSSGNASFVNSTISGNDAPAGSGPTYVVTNQQGSISMTNVTVTQNVVRDSGAAVAPNPFFSAAISSRNSIIAGNVNLPSVAGKIRSSLGINSYNVQRVTSLGNNLIGFAAPGDGFDPGLPNLNNDYAGSSLLPLDPLLGALSNNGGETETHALLTGSLALDNGTLSSAPATDQRGVARPQGAANDIGAFEKEVVPNPPLRIVTDPNLPTGVVDQAYLLQIVAADGNPPYSFALTGGALPDGITLLSSGSLGGTPTQSGNFSFTVTATDSSSGTAVRTFQLAVQPPLQILTSSLPSGTRNQPYSAQLIADGGVPSYVFSQTGGTLPSGISLSSSGLLSGTPTTWGSFSFQVTLTDTHGGSAQRTLVLTIFPALEIYNETDLPTGITNQSYTLQLIAVGGVSPYNFSLVSGTLPNGFSFSANGVISGLVTQPATSDLLIKVTDSVGNQFQKQFRLTISDLYIVTTNADTNDGVCDAHCSLREAVAVGDSIPGSSNVIAFSALFDSPTRINLNSTISIKKTTEIRGKGMNKTFISSNNVNLNSKFEIIGTGNTALRDLRIDNGGSSGQWTRAIYNQSTGQLMIENSILRGNATDRLDGGAILQTAGNLKVNNSTFRNNYITTPDLNCAGKGAAIAFFGGTARITNSSFNDNGSPAGGAIYGNGTVKIENSTISGSSVTSTECNTSLNATILNESGSIAISNSTVIGNQINGVAGSALKGNITIWNSISAANRSYGGIEPSSPNFGTGVISLGHNLISFAPNLTAGSPNANGDYVGSGASPLDPLLNALALNGGETETHAPTVLSLAIDNGRSFDAPATDQRGVARPQGAGVDIGAFESGVAVVSANTPVGIDVVAPLGTVSVTFSGVSQSGTTTQIPIAPATAGTLPGTFSFGTGLPAFQITTTAVYTPPVTICIQVPGLFTLQQFNLLALLHNESGVLVDRTVSRDFPSRTICAETTSLSPFAVAETLAPTAANVSVSGRVATSSGNAIPRATVQLTDQNGGVITAISNGFGYYRFDEVPVGSYVVSVSSKQFNFAPQMLNLSESVEGLDLSPQE